MPENGMVMTEKWYYIVTTIVTLFSTIEECD